MQRLQLLKGGRDPPAPHCKKAPNKNGKWDIIHCYQANHPNPASSLSFKTWPWKFNRNSEQNCALLGWVASENGSHQVALAGLSSALCFHTRIWHLTSPGPSAQCPWHSGVGHSVAGLGHGSATRHWWHSGCILINC